MATASGGVTDVSQFISQIAPTLVNQRTGTNETTTVAPDAISLSNIAFLQAMEQAGSTQDALVKNIMTRAAQAFAPTLAEEHTSGVYNSSTQAQLQNEAMARATGEAADAVLKAQTVGLQTEANISSNRVNAQRSTQTNVTKSPSLGKSAGTIATAAIAAQLAKKGIGKLSDLFTSSPSSAAGELPEQLGGGPAVEEALAAGAPEQLGGGGAVDAAAAALEGAGGAAGADSLIGDSAPELLSSEEAASEGGTALEAGEGADLAGETAISSAAADEAGTATALGAAGELAGAGVVGAGIEGSIEGRGGALSDFSGGAPGAVLGSAANDDAGGALENFATGGVSGVINDVGSFLGF